MRDLGSYKEAIAINIRGFRESRGLTQQQIAELAGLARSHISALEQGLGNPSLESLHSLAKALDVDIETLLMDVSNQE